jgi:hypothetical protein
MPILAHPDAVYLGLDIHKDSISAGILNPGCDGAHVEQIFDDGKSVRRSGGTVPGAQVGGGVLRGGADWLQPAPAAAPFRDALCGGRPIDDPPGDKVKADKRDCRRLPRLYRAGELVAIRVSSSLEETVRDLCRTRGKWSRT